MIEIIKFGIQLPRDYERKARRIAKYKGTARATWIGFLVQARVEALYPDYLKFWEQDAADAGISLEDFIKQLDNETEN